MLFGSHWIIELVPWWVAALTHLIFGWTVAATYPLARFAGHGTVVTPSVADSSEPETSTKNNDDFHKICVLLALVFGGLILGSLLALFLG